jgi:serine carboxypeptidase 1
MAVYSVVGFLLGLLLCLEISTVTCKGNVISGTTDGSEKWGYIEVRPQAHMFWWLYYSPGQTSDNWPLILWLQGGPGASGVAIGNFQEVGPLDTQLKPRKTTWLQKADLLFVDSPVATGFSYVEDSSLVATTDAEVTADLLSFLKDLFGTISTLQKRPLFIVGESYGGKHASMIGLALSKAIAAGDMKVNLGGVLLGDSWISPVDYVLSWGPLLVDVSRLEAADKDDANSIALQIKQQVKSGEYMQATNSWEQLESLIGSNSNNVDFYNFLLDSSADPLSTSTMQSRTISTPRHYSQYLSSKKNKKENGRFDSATFMNGVIRKKLKVIPSNKIWNDQTDLVFPALESDFMKSVVDQVDELLSRGENVTIYNGQVDLICATIGTEAWVQKLKWQGLKEFNSIRRTPLYCDGSETKGFVKLYKNLRFFWVLRAGHFVPVDQPCVALKMLDLVINSTSF